MRTLHRAMMGVLMIAVVAFAAGTLRPASLTAESQHGDQADHDGMNDPAAHFEHVATMLELTDAQREKLAAPFDQAFAVMQQMHHLHEVIAAELTDTQREKLAEMMHQAMGMMQHDGDHDGDHDGEGHRGMRHQ